MSFAAWHVDPSALAAALATLGAYLLGVRSFESRRTRAWPRARGAAFACGVASGVLALESPLDAAADARFAPHMIEHLILSDVTAPLLLLGAPLLLAFGALPARGARRLVTVLRSRVAHALTFPPFTWTLFVVSLWAVHFSGFFEAALEHEPLHVLEHALLLGTALLFWLPVIAIGPTPWVDGPLAFPLRMLYVFVAMPTQAILGFALYTSRHKLYAHYAAVGIGDQQSAGEIMWIGGGLVMLLAFLFLGYAWSRHDARLAARVDARS